MASNDEKAISVLVHILGLFFSFLGPLIVFLVSSGKGIKEHSKNALNWQLSLMIYTFVAFILVFLLVGIIILPLLFLADIIFCIMAAVKAANNETWKYPLSIPFVK
ncbi:MAG: DUF4870 domain-containing protein [Candidatus Woesearchaeota archaeon]